MSIAAIILSAGYSSRMGEFKPLLSFGDTTVLERVISLFHDGGVQDVRVVIGHRAPELLPTVERMQARPVMNGRFHEGMFSSVLAGVESLEGVVEAFFLLPVDIPLVTPPTVSLLVQAFRGGEGSIIYPVFFGKRGHPPLISARFRGEILAWNGEGGLKTFLARHETDAVNIETEDENILLDMDTFSDYERLRSAWHKRSIPSVDECEMLLAKRFSLERSLLDHCRRVADLAVFLAKQLNEAGCSLDTGLVAAASILHDFAKGKPNHAAEGARLLDEAGYPEVAKVIAVHMDITVDECAPVSTGEVLYLADKMAGRNHYVSVEERFAPRLQSHVLDPAILGVVTVRLKNALAIRNKIEAVLGRPLSGILSENGFM